jgi:hypothetical protein
MSSLHPVAACVRRAARRLRGRRAQKAALLAASATLLALVGARALAWLVTQLQPASALARGWLETSAGSQLAIALALVAALAAAAVASAWPVDEARLALVIDRERGLSDLFSSAWEFAQVESASRSAFVSATLARAAIVASAIPAERALPRRAPRELARLGALFALLVALLVVITLQPWQLTAARRNAEPQRDAAALPPPEPLLRESELARHRARLARSAPESAAIAGVRADLQALLAALEAGQLDRVQALRELRAIEQRTEALGLTSARVERALRELARRFAQQPATRALGQRLAGAVHGVEQPGTLAGLDAASSAMDDARDVRGASAAPPFEPGSAEQAHRRALDLAAARAELERLAHRLREPGVDARALEALRSALSSARATPPKGNPTGAGAGAGQGVPDPTSAAARPLEAASPRAGAETATGHSTPQGAAPQAALADGSNRGRAVEAAGQPDGFADRSAAGPAGPGGARVNSDVDRESGRELERLARDLEQAERALGEAQPSEAADALDRASRELEQLQEAQRAAEHAPRLRDEIAELRESLRRNGSARADARERRSAAPPGAGARGLADPDAEPSAADAAADPATQVTAQPTRVTGVAQAGPTRSQVIFGAAQPGAVSSAYARVHADYAQHAERELEREPIPPGYRLYVRRYFQLVGPRVARAGDVERAP